MTYVFISAKTMRDYARKKNPHIKIMVLTAVQGERAQPQTSTLKFHDYARPEKLIWPSQLRESNVDEKRKLL